MRKTLTRLFMAVLMVTLLVGASIMSVSAETSCDVADHAAAGHVNVNTLTPVNYKFVLDQANTTYYLSADVTRQVEVTATGVTLCMCGHSITHASNAITVTGEVTVVNCGDAESEITATGTSNRGIYVNTAGKVTIGSNVKVTGGDAAVFLLGDTTGGQLVVDGGTILGTDDSNGAVFANGGKITLTSGAIKVGASDTNTVAVKVATRNSSTGEFTMTGGALGGTISSTNATVTITGGKFSVDPSAHLSNGYEAGENTEGDAGTYPYVVTQNAHAAAGHIAVEVGTVEQDQYNNFLLNQANTTYYLSGDVTNQIKVSATGVTLCLCGHSITTTNVNAIDMASGGLTVVNCKGTVGKITTTNTSASTRRAINIASGTSVTLESGVSVADSTGVNEAVFVQGTFTMEAGSSITNNAGAASGGVHVYTGGTFIMEGGSITDNTASASDGASGVKLVNTGAMTMTGGAISGSSNVIRNQSSGAVTLSDGDITGNIYTAAAATGTLTISGTLAVTGGITHDGGPLNISGGTVSGAVTVRNNGVGTISGGTFAGAVSTATSQDKTGTLAITGGSFAGTVSEAASDTVTISGGKFKTEPAADLLKSGYEVTTNPDVDVTTYPYVVAEEVAEPTHECELHPDVTEWTVLTNSNKTITTGGNYYLDAAFANKITVSGDITVTICMNGYNNEYGWDGLEVTGGATVNLVNCKTSGGLIHRTGTGGGPAVKVSSGTLNMGENVTIKTNGTVYAVLADGASSVFNMNGGTITGNDVASGAVRASNSGVVNVNGGAISNGTNDVVTVLSSGTVSVKGGKFSKAPDAYVASGYTVGANTGDDAATYPYVVEKLTHTCELYPDVDTAQWKAITTADGYTISEGGSYYLATNMTGQILVTTTEKVTLCMNGYSVEASDIALYCSSGCDITVVNCDDEDESVIKTTDAARAVEVRGTATIKDGVSVSGNTSTSTETAVFIYGGTFTMESGSSVKNNTLTKAGSTGGVYIHNGGTFIMNAGATITGNTGATAGGVRVYTNSTFNMNDGTISGNTTSGNASGVYVEGSGAFAMKGGTLSGSGNVIRYNSSRDVTLSNGDITGDIYTASATTGTLTISGTLAVTGGITHDGGPLNITGGTVSGAVTVRNNGVGTISGGTFAGTVATGTNGNTGTLTIKGGSFAGKVSEVTDSNTVTIIGGQFSDKNDMAVLRGFVGVDPENTERMLSVIDMGTATYRYKVAEGYAYDGEHMDYKSSLALSIYLGSDNGKLVTDTTGITVTAKSATKEYEPTMTYDSTAGKMLLTASGIAAKEIHDKITFTVTTEGGDVLFSKTMSVYDAAAEAKAAKQAEEGDATTIANHIAMLEDVVNYGIEAQKEFGYTVGATLGTGSTNAWTEKTGDSDKTWNDGEVAISLFLEERIELNFYLKGEGVADLVLTSDVAHTVDREYAEGVIRVTFDNIDVVDAMDPVTLNVGDKYITSSIVDYVITNNSQSGLMSALAKYVQSVYNVLSDAQ